MSIPPDTFMPPTGPQLHVDDAGGMGLPVLFQHGLCGQAAQPAEVFPQITAFRRITLECRGHGGSEAGEHGAFSIATFTDDVVALIAARKLAPVVMGGISMGAAIAMRIAVLHPELVSALIIARPAWSTAAAPANMQPNAEAGRFLRMPAKDEALAAFMAGDTAKRLAAEAPDNLATLRGFFRREPHDVTAALLLAIAADGPGVTAAQLQSISVPTLVIGNRADSIHPFAMAEEIAALITTARLVEIMPKSQDRVRYVADFQAALDSFLKGLPP